MCCTCDLDKGVQGVCNRESPEKKIDDISVRLTGNCSVSCNAVSEEGNQAVNVFRINGNLESMPREQSSREMHCSTNSSMSKE